MCKFDVSHNSLIAECWAPVKVLDQVQAALQYSQVCYLPHAERMYHNSLISEC